MCEDVINQNKGFKFKEIFMARVLSSAIANKCYFSCSHHLIVTINVQKGGRAEAGEPPPSGGPLTKTSLLANRVPKVYGSFQALY